MQFLSDITYYQTSHKCKWMCHIKILRKLLEAHSHSASDFMGTWGVLSLCQFCLKTSDGYFEYFLKVHYISHSLKKCVETFAKVLIYGYIRSKILLLVANIRMPRRSNYSGFPTIQHISSRMKANLLKYQSLQNFHCI